MRQNRQNITHNQALMARMKKFFGDTILIFWGKIVSNGHFEEVLNKHCSPLRICAYSGFILIVVIIITAIVNYIKIH
jgi:uncharacterized membrane protein